MYITTRGLVLRETEYKDHDRILTILTQDAGLVTARAWGVKKNTSAIRSGCQLLAYSEFTFHEKQGFTKVQEASSIELFTPVRRDIVKLALASYFAQAAEVLSQEDAPDPGLLRLLLYALRALSLDRDAALVKASFEMMLASLAGYEPDFSACVHCGCEDPDLFNVTMGVLQCAVCRKDGLEGLHLPVSPGTLDALRYLIACPPEKAFSFCLGQQSAKELSDIAEAYLLTRLERGFYTLDFYKSLFYT